ERALMCAASYRGGVWRGILVTIPDVAAWRSPEMRGIGIALCLALTWGLGGCFVQHAALIGAAEPVVPQQWSGGWVAEPLESGGEPGFFVVADVDPATGAFTVSAADADGDAMDDPIALHLRRVGDTLFLDAREKDDDPWMLFVVSEITADRIVLAWKP